MSCELCELVQGNVITDKYYEDNLIIVVDCQTCSKDDKHIPMAVIKRHDTNLTNAEYKCLNAKLMEIGRKVFGVGKFWICRKPKKIKNHMHWHLRLS